MVHAIEKAEDWHRQQLVDLGDLKKIAVRKHGGNVSPAPASAPEPPPAAPSIADQAATEPHQKNEPLPPLSIADLIHSYCTHEESPYRKLQFSSRQNYDRKLRLLKKDCGNTQIANLGTEEIQRLYDGWFKGNKTATAHGLITMLRGLANYGVDVLKDFKCELLSLTLHRMHFDNVKARKERLTAEHVAAIIAKAHELGHHTIALAQAFQFECKLAQKDVIGEWVPIDEPVQSDVLDRLEGKKWARGLVGSEIDKDLVLRHRVSVGGEIKVVRLSRCPLVMTELQALYGNPLELPQGALMISEYTGRPYHPKHFRQLWRTIARAAGVPDAVRNMDSRKEEDADDDAEETIPVATELTQATTRHLN